jgi:uncharacterized protein YceK
MHSEILMARALVLMAIMAWLVGCGVVETGAAAAAGATSAVEEARQAKETEARLQQQMDAANRQAAEQRKSAETASE